MSELKIEPNVILEGPDYENNREWFVPRIAALPDGRAVMLATRATLDGSDVFLGNARFLSTDGGRSWSEPRDVEPLGRQTREDGTVLVPGDLVPEYHRATGKVLACGQVANYNDPDAKLPLESNRFPVPTCYSVWDPDADAWQPWKLLGPLDEEHFYWCCGGPAQRVELPGGDVLLPVYAMSREDVGENFWKACFFTTVLRCSFDGEELKVLEQGNEISVEDVRGLCEPSLVEFGGRYLLTLRNDVRGYVAESSDGLHFENLKPWTFDDGEQLGSYNTQQHWARVGGRLYLVYTRRGANNDHVVRHRAPQFLAEVDPERLVVLRDSERVIMPDNGGAFGNGGVTHVNENEAWVTDAEAMCGDSEDVFNIELTRRRGANNRVYLVRLTAGQ
jgi:hypothetical protein